ELGPNRVLGDRSVRPWLEHQAQPVSVERTTAETMAVPLNFHGKNYRGSREVDAPTYLPTRWGGIRRGGDGPTYLPTRWGGIRRGVDGPTYLPTRWGGIRRGVDGPTYLPTRWGGIRRGVDGPTYLPTRWGGIHCGVDGPTSLPSRGGGTCSHFPEKQPLQFHAPVRCSALPLPESAMVMSA